MQHAESGTLKLQAGKEALKQVQVAAGTVSAARKHPGRLPGLAHLQRVELPAAALLQQQAGGALRVDARDVGAPLLAHHAEGHRLLGARVQHRGHCGFECVREREEAAGW